MGTIKRYEISSLADLRTIIGRNNAVGFIGALNATYTDDDGVEFDVTLYSGALRGTNYSPANIDFVGECVRMDSTLMAITTHIELNSASGYIYAARQRRARLTNRTLLCKECA